MDVRRAGLGLVVAFVAGASAGSCKYRQGEEFNEQAAEYICRAVTECDNAIRTGEDLVQGHDGCKLELMNALDECDAHCEYHPASARSCISDLKTSSECRRDPARTKACERVYTNCDEDFFDRDICTLDVPTCAVSRGAGDPGWAVFSVGLGLWAIGRRRRRFFGPTSPRCYGR